MYNFSQQLVIDLSVYTYTIIQRQTRIERESLEVRIGIYFRFTVVTVGQELFDADSALQVNYWHVGLDGWPIECGCGGFAASFTRFIPGRCSNGEALGRRYNGVESVQRGARYQSGLIVDPDMFHAFEGIREHNPLASVSLRV